MQLFLFHLIKDSYLEIQNLLLKELGLIKEALMLDLSIRSSTPKLLELIFHKINFHYHLLVLNNLDLNNDKLNFN